MSVYAGPRPGHARDLRAEEAGILPLTPEEQYATPRRTFLPWYAGNVEWSGFVLGTLPVLLGLGFRWGLVALVVSMVLGAVPVAWLGMYGPSTGTAQIAQARGAFGKAIWVPGLAQVLSAIGWIAIGALFGAQAVQQLGLPFWAGMLIVVGVIAAIVIYGYEVQTWVLYFGSVLMTALFAVVVVQLFRHHTTMAPVTAHGTALIGAFVLMLAIGFSGPFSWLPYAGDYSRYVRADASRAKVFWYALAGMCISYLGVSVIGLAAASAIGSNSTVPGVWHLMGGGGYGDTAMVAIVFAAVVASSINGYSTTLAAQAAGIPLRRVWLAVAASVLALAGVWWLHTGSVASHFTNLLLFTAYWCAPLLGTLTFNLWYHRRVARRDYNADDMRELLDWRKLPAGRKSLAALVLGFCAMLPFMDNSVIDGPAAKTLAGADISYPVGFFAALFVCWVLYRFTPGEASQSGLAVVTARRKAAA
jgi:NCS1 family nucleobase:cation symporter-1